MSSVSWGWKRMPPLAGPRASLCWTRKPRKIFTRPSSMRTGMAKLCSRIGKRSSSRVAGVEIEDGGHLVELRLRDFERIHAFDGHCCSFRVTGSGEPRREATCGCCGTLSGRRRARAALARPAPPCQHSDSPSAATRPPAGVGAEPVRNGARRSCPMDHLCPTRSASSIRSAGTSTAPRPTRPTRKGCSSRSRSATASTTWRSRSRRTTARSR